MEVGTFVLAACALADVGGVEWLAMPLAALRANLDPRDAGLLDPLDVVAPRGPLDPRGKPKTLHDFLMDSRLIPTLHGVPASHRADALDRILTALCALAGSPAPTLRPARAPRDASREALRAWASAHGVTNALLTPTRVGVASRGRSRTPRMVTYSLIPLEALTDDPARTRDGTSLTGAALTAARDTLYQHLEAQALEAEQATGLRAWFDAVMDRSPPPALLALDEALAAKARSSIDERIASTPGRVAILPAVRFHGSPPRLEYAEWAVVGAQLKSRVTADIDLGGPAPVVRAGYGIHGATPGAVTLAALHDARRFLRCTRAPTHQALVDFLGTADWERTLRAIDGALAAPQPPAPTFLGDGERLAWRVTQARGEEAVRLVAWVQRPKKGGGWSLGSELPLATISERIVAGLVPPDADRAAIAALLANASRYSLAPPPRLAARVLDALVGHPAVFLMDHDEEIAVTVRRATPRMVVVAREEREETGVTGATEGALVVRFEVDGLEVSAHRIGDAARDSIVVCDAASRAIVVASCPPFLKSIAHALAHNPRVFPAESRAALVERLARIAPNVDLVLADSIASRTVAGETGVVVRLRMEGAAALEVEVRTRVAADVESVVPGAGSASVVRAAAGAIVRIEPDLEGERIAARAIAESLALAPSEGGAGPFIWSLPELDALSKREDVTVEWLGARVEIARRLERDALRVRVREGHDWFGLEGEVDLDGARVSLAVLLDAARRGQRWVSVGARAFARIADDLRAKLVAACELATPSRHGLEVGLAATPAIADLVTDSSALDAPRAWLAILTRMRASTDVEPEIDPALAAVLRHYQVDGIRWLSRLTSWGAGACLADDMGLGKTVQTLAVMASRAGEGPSLVIAPTSVASNWQREAARFAPSLRVRLHRGAARAQTLTDLVAGDVVVTSYDIAVRDAELLNSIDWGTLVLDEAQAVKNAATERAKMVRAIPAKWRVALSGTPIENHLGELWSLFRIVSPGLLGSWESFKERFAIPIEREGDVRRRDALATLVRPFLLRRTKEVVAPELPAVTEITQLVDPSDAERALYDDARLAAIARVADAKEGGDARFQLLAELTKLRRLACHPRLYDPTTRTPSSKLEAFLEIVDELRETDHRALVFSQFTGHLALVAEALEAAGVTYLYLDGATPAPRRSELVDAFQRGEATLFLISLKAGGTGLNLTAADYVVHLDPWWNPAVEDQATDRAHRIGQTRPVTVIRLVAKATIEEAVVALHAEKRALADAVLDGAETAARLSSDDLVQLIRAGERGTPAAIPQRAAAARAPAVEARVAPARPSKSTLSATRAPRLDPLDGGRARLLKRLTATGQLAPTSVAAYRRCFDRLVAFARARRAPPAEESLDAIVEAYAYAVATGSLAAPKSELVTVRGLRSHLRALESASP